MIPKRKTSFENVCFCPELSPSRDTPHHFVDTFGFLLESKFGAIESYISLIMSANVIESKDLISSLAICSIIGRHVSDCLLLSSLDRSLFNRRLMWVVAPLGRGFGSLRSIS